MKKPLEVGMRVRVLDVDRSMNPSREVMDKGTVTDVNTVSPGAVRVKCDTWKNDFNNGSWFHARQIRILKKKAKPVVEERKARRVWIHGMAFLIHSPKITANLEPIGDEGIEFQEVLPNTVTISRGDLARAWDEVVADGVAISHNIGSGSSGHFRELSKSLGFEGKK